MYKITKTKLFEAFSFGDLEGYINNHLQNNPSDFIIDIKFLNMYERDTQEEFLDLNENGETTDKIFSAVLIYGEEN